MTPEIPQKAPYPVELEAGSYYFCTCGKSQKQPFCDGAHKGGEFRPINFQIEEKKTVYLCGCKHSGKNPFCDGTHKSL